MISRKVLYVFIVFSFLLIHIARGGIIYVDDDGLHDPTAYDPTDSDPNENGSSEHPFDSIQEGIEAAQSGDTVIVRHGTYRESIYFQEKHIKVMGYEPNASGEGMLSSPVIDAHDSGPVVTFTNNQDPNTELSGFVITGGLSIIGGGIVCAWSHPTISNCLIVGNRRFQTYNGGGAVSCIDSNAVFINCTISGNYGEALGVPFYADINSHPVIRNSIIWGNSPANILMVDTNAAPTLLVFYSDVQAALSGQGNIAQDPLFVEPGYWADPNDPNIVLEPNEMHAVWIDGDYHLQSQSPCIDAGDPAMPFDTQDKDIDGNPRVSNGRVDMGCYEYKSDVPPIGNDPVYFPDENLKAVVIRELAEIGIIVTDPTPMDMLDLFEVETTATLADLTGLEYAVNLETLKLNQPGNIQDLSPLADLQNLKHLQIDGCPGIRDLGPLSGLTQLEILNLHHNDIEDLSPLSGLTNLEELYLYENYQIRRVSALLGLTKLRNLDLEDNPLSAQAYCDLETIGDNNPDLTVSTLLFDDNTDPPIGVFASNGSYADKVQISWNEVCNGPFFTVLYSVYRATSTTGDKETISSSKTDPSFDDTTAIPGVTYYYWVKTNKSSDYSSYDTGWR